MASDWRVDLSSWQTRRTSLTPRDTLWSGTNRDADREAENWAHSQTRQVKKLHSGLCFISFVATEHDADFVHEAHPRTYGNAVPSSLLHTDKAWPTPPFGQNGSGAGNHSSWFQPWSHSLLFYFRAERKHVMLSCLWRELLLPMHKRSQRSTRSGQIKTGQVEIRSSFWWLNVVSVPFYKNKCFCLSYSL